MMAHNDPNGGIAAKTHEKASGVYAYAQKSLDRVIEPESRQKAYDTTVDFASARPIVFSFIVSQFIFSFLPLLIFATFAISTVAFALGSAIIFSLFWIGVAMLLLVPTLLVTFSIAVLVWGWAVGSFVVARWLYNHAPVGVKGDVEVEAGGKRVTVYKEGKNVDGEITDVI
ncbi:Fc.00g075310.m01.CDS01 [Cosmosporella sp. VM-42]